MGSAFAQIATRRSFFESCALADRDAARPETVLARQDDGRFSAHTIDASSKDSVVALVRETRADAVLNSVDPLFNVPIFDASIVCAEKRPSSSRARTLSGRAES